jgi:hypothetical protein
MSSLWFGQCNVAHQVYGTATEDMDALTFGSKVCRLRLGTALPAYGSLPIAPGHIPRQQSKGGGLTESPPPEQILLRHMTYSEARKMPIQEFHLDAVLKDLELSMDEVRCKDRA